MTLFYKYLEGDNLKIYLHKNCKFEKNKLYKIFKKIICHKCNLLHFKRHCKRGAKKLWNF